MRDRGNGVEQRQAQIGEDWLPLLVTKVRGEPDPKGVRLSFPRSCFALNHDHPILKDGNLRHFPCAIGIRRYFADRLLVPISRIKEERLMSAAFELMEDRRFGECGTERDGDFAGNLSGEGLPVISFGPVRLDDLRLRLQVSTRNSA